MVRGKSLINLIKKLSDYGSKDKSVDHWPFSKGPSGSLSVLLSDELVSPTSRLVQHRLQKSGLNGPSTVFESVRVGQDVEVEMG